MPERAGVIEPETWRRCVCDQFGRCLTGCSSADLVRPGPTFYWNRRLGKWVHRG